MARPFDLELVRAEIDAEVRRKRLSGELPVEVEEELDRELTRLGFAGGREQRSESSGAHRQPVMLVKRALRKALRRLRPQP